jgi:hypothetical protein
MKPQNALPVLLTAIAIAFGLTVSDGSALPLLGAGLSTALCLAGIFYIIFARIPEGASAAASVAPRDAKAPTP